MRKFAVVLCALLLPQLAGAATITYNTALEQVNGTISKIGVDPAGNLLVVGSISAGAAVISISPSGSVNSTWVAPSTADIIGRNSTFGSDGSAYITGSGSLPIPNPTILYVGSNINPNFIATIDPLGNLLWVSYLGDYSPNAIALDNSGNIYTVGQAAEGTPFTAKLDPGGASVLYLNQSVGGSLIAVSKNGGVVTEDTVYVVDPGPPISSGPLQIISVLDSNGNVVTAGNFGESAAIEVQALQLDTEGDIYLAGAASGPGFPVTSDALQTAFPSLPVDAAPRTIVSDPGNHPEIRTDIVPVSGSKPATGNARNRQNATEIPARLRPTCVRSRCSPKVKAYFHEGISSSEGEHLLR